MNEEDLKWSDVRQMECQMDDEPDDEPRELPHKTFDQNARRFADERRRQKGKRRPH